MTKAEKAQKKLIAKPKKKPRSAPEVPRVTRYTRASKKVGRPIYCPRCNCQKVVRHFAWSEVLCENCRSWVAKAEWLLESDPSAGDPSAVVALPSPEEARRRSAYLKLARAREDDPVVAALKESLEASAFAYLVGLERFLAGAIEEDAVAAGDDSQRDPFLESMVGTATVLVASAAGYWADVIRSAAPDEGPAVPKEGDLRDFFGGMARDMLDDQLEEGEE